MDTPRNERIQRLLQLLKTTDKLHLKKAAIELGVSEMTIRRDLSNEPCAISLLGGYLVSETKPASLAHYFVSDQQQRQVEEKKRIGRRAAHLIADNDTVFFDCGTTIPFIIHAIPDELPFTALCYSLNTFLALQDKPLCRVILCGGEFHSANYVFSTPSLPHLLDLFCPDKAFISAAGVTLPQGVTGFNLEEIATKQRAILQSRESILVIDHSKWGKIKPARIGALNQFQQIISDALPDQQILDYCEKYQISLQLTEPRS